MSTRTNKTKNDVWSVECRVSSAKKEIREKQEKRKGNEQQR